MLIQTLDNHTSKKILKKNHLYLAVFSFTGINQHKTSQVLTINKLSISIYSADQEIFHCPAMSEGEIPHYKRVRQTLNANGCCVAHCCSLHHYTSWIYGYCAPYLVDFLG